MHKTLVVFTTALATVFGSMALIAGLEPIPLFTDTCALFLEQDPDDPNEPFSGSCLGACDGFDDCDINTVIGTSYVSYFCECGDDLSEAPCPALYTYEEPHTHTITCPGDPDLCVSPAMCTPQVPPTPSPGFSGQTLACACK